MMAATELLLMMLLLLLLFMAHALRSVTQRTVRGVILVETIPRSDGCGEPRRARNRPGGEGRPSKRSKRRKQACAHHRG